MLKEIIKQIFAFFDYELRKRSRYFVDAFQDQKKLLEQQNVQFIFDCGANIGQTTAKYRKLFPNATIYSFEPTHKTFNILDDTELTDTSAIDRAISIAKSYADVGAIAFHQLCFDGTSHAFQPANVDYLSYIVTPAFYGCLIRREALLKLEIGFIEEFNYYYEEVEFTLRLLDAGYKVIYDPELKIIHYADERGRNWQRIRRLWARNAMLTTLLRYPWLAVFPALIATLITFLRMKDEREQRDWAGVFWIVSSLTNLLPFALSNRQPIKNQTLKLFKQLRRKPMPVLPQEVNNFT
ncbi:hypothetical protein [Anabaena catenula]|uniref:Uncharacterized protein n=1 Tax=Anabaena catenula FACHB-362 TaxID=2692877 RepID=A0ABR8J3I0_9NOST|nr:hypothetical protein [Anabaena catenula]MBD2692160.1 hypothetical protein [Anabaena catenula FACHB-362]